MFPTGILLTFYYTEISSKSSFKISDMGKVLTLPPMCVIAIFLRISIYVPRILWLGVKLICNWTFELSEQVITTKISQKCYILVVIEQAPTIFYSLNDVSVNSMSMFICAKFDKLKMYIYTAKHIKCYTGFSNSGCDPIINGIDVDREPQRLVKLDPYSLAPSLLRHSLLHNRYREAHLACLSESLIWLPTKGWTGCH